ncbi:MAG: Spo0E family sporulation regulatory protein-aspartic acid phosphatase [Lachnospiraceae bacterium]|jgi:hypothetical protein|nr:Spo0E family sporulation regulatory protein-aspartic acid phosphatase [Lachnospiraceae bacterium]
MNEQKDQLVTKIEEARGKLNRSIDNKEDYDTIYQHSILLDTLIEQYIVAESNSQP